LNKAFKEKLINKFALLKSEFATGKGLATLIIIASVLLSLALWISLGLSIYKSYTAREQFRQDQVTELLSALDLLREAEEETETEEEIVSRFEPRFKALENLAADRLGDLFDEALEEYTEQKEAGTLDSLRFTNRYIQKGRELEKTFDEVFARLLEEMKSELRENGLPTGAASVITELYNNAKDEKKQELLKELRQKISS
jgi:hypothetical protein